MVSLCEPIRSGCSGNEGRGSLARRFPNLLTVVLVAAIVVTRGGPSSGAKPDEASLLRRDFPVLTQRVGIAEPADYVVALDISKSMKKFWPEVKGSLASFVNAIPDGDYVSILAFGSAAGFLVTPAPISPQTRQQIGAALNSLHAPTDDKTDLGAGVEKVIEELNRPGGNRLKFVFLVTDFDADPPAGSPFRRDDSPMSPAWRKLVATRTSVLSNKILDVQAFVLNLGDARTGRNLNLVQAVFRELQWQRIDSPAALSAWFARRQAEIARSKLQAIVRQDLMRTPLAFVRVESACPLLGDRTQLSLVLLPTPGAAAVGSVTPKALSVFSGGSDDGAHIAQAPLPASVSTTGDVVRFPVGTVTWSGHPWLSSTEHERVTIRLAGTWTARPDDEIARLNLQPQVPFEFSAEVPVTVKHGIVPLWLASACLACLFAFVGAVAYNYRPERIRGELFVAGVGTRVVTSGERLKRLAVGNVAAGEGWVVPRVAWRLTLRAVRTGEEKGMRRGTYVRIEQGTGNIEWPGMKSRSAGGGWVPLPRGSRITLGVSSLTWN